MECHLTSIYKPMLFFSYLLSVFPYSFELFVNFYDMNEICSCLGSLLCPDLGKFFPRLAVSWFLCRQFTCDFKPLATSQLHWMAHCSPHHKLGLKLPVIQVSSCLETGVSCIFQTVPVWHSAFMKFLCMQACRVCMWKYVSHVGVCRCTWVYTVETWTYVCRTEVHLMYSTQSSHLFFFHTGCLTEAEACQFG